MSTQSHEEFIDNMYELTQTRQRQRLTKPAKKSQKGKKGNKSVVSNQKSVLQQKPKHKQSTEFHTPKETATAEKKRKIMSFESDEDQIRYSEFQNPHELDDSDEDEVFVDFDADLPQLTECADMKERSEILNTLSTWLGDMNAQMQQTFRRRFEEAMEEFKDEVLDHVDSKDAHNTEIDDVRQENRELQNRCRILEGRITRAEREIEELREDSLKQKARSMRDNIKFFNIPEVEGDDEDDEDEDVEDSV